MKLSPILIVGIALLGASVYTAVDAKTKTAQLPQPVPQTSQSPSPTPSASPTGPAPSPSPSPSPSTTPTPAPSPISQQEQEKKVLQAYQGEQKQPEQPVAGEGQETGTSDRASQSTFIPTHIASCQLDDGRECYVRIRPYPRRGNDEVGKILPGEQAMVLNKRVRAEGVTWVYVVNQSGEKGWAAESILKRIGG